MRLLLILVLLCGCAPKRVEKKKCWIEPKPDKMVCWDDADRTEDRDKK